MLEKNTVQDSFPRYLQANKHICPRGAHLHQNFTSFWNYLQFVHISTFFYWRSGSLIYYLSSLVITLCEATSILLK